MGLSSFASKAIEDVVVAGPPVFFQVYWTGRDRITQLVDRARAAGAHGLIITLDWTSPTAATGAAPRSPNDSTCPPWPGSRHRRSPVRDGC
jgi:isopentenyl diphosphate isomerase/L-lactate dehydrogenase-like FMN-dependent dehydrogenase